MTNKDFQKELLEKVKPGTKPSDIKKGGKKQDQKPISPSPIEEYEEKDEGYESEEEKNIPTIPTPPPLPNQNLQNQIKSLNKQLQTYKDFKEADLKIKEKLKGEIEQWKEAVKKSNTLIADKEQVIKELQAKVNRLCGGTDKENNKEPSKLFTCLTCQKSFSIKFLRLVDKNNKKVCRDCLLKMLNRANQETGEEIVLRKKKKVEENIQTETKSFTCQTCQQTYQGEPHQVHITNFQDQGIIPQQLTSICSFCLEDKVILANFYCPRTSEGRDTYNEPQFDCNCPTNP